METHKFDVRIMLSLGILVFALVHAVTLATAQRIAPHVEQALFESPQTVAPNVAKGGINFDESRNSGGVVNTLPVNSSARDEIKRGQPCIPCSNQPQTNQPFVLPASPSTGIQMVAKPTTPRYSIELFVLHNDSESQRVLNWFNSDATLQKWRKSTNFNVYSKDNPTYLTRFANKIPNTSFPCVLVTDPTGGDVYFCDRASIPTSVEALTSTIAERKRIQAQTVAMRDTPRNDFAVSDYSVKDSLMEAIVGECADGKCKPKPFWRSDHDDDHPVNGLLRMIVRPGETIFQIVLVMAVVVVVVFLVKRGGR